MSYGGTNLDAPSNAIIDSGTSYIMLLQSTYDALTPYFEKAGMVCSISINC